MAPWGPRVVWQPVNNKGRARPDPGRWRGPATVIMCGGDSKVYLNWMGRLLLAAPEQLRTASVKEQGMADVISAEAGLMAEQYKESDGRTAYEDIRGSGPSVDKGPAASSSGQQQPPSPSPPPPVPPAVQPPRPPPLVPPPLAVLPAVPPPLLQECRH